MLPGQEKVSALYNGTHVQVFVAVLIGANFLTNIVEKEIDPHGIHHKDTFGGFELFYNICFTIELVVNMYSHWFRKFWRSNWNIFDVVVVLIGIVNTLNLPLPPSFSMFRMMRAFRVFRLFKRVHSLNKIIVAIMHAVPGVMNAFLILAIVMSIYSILAVEFYYEMGDDCLQTGGDAGMRTPRGYCVGHEYFGTFTKSIYTFFQVLTGESWSEMVARPAIWYYHDDPIRAVGGGFFFVTYVLVSSFVLTNVVVAVLLDKMVDPEVAEVVVQRISLAYDEPIDLAALDLEGEEGNETQGGDDNTIQNGAAVQNPVDLHHAMASVTEQVDQLMTNSERMSSEIDIFRRDIALMRDQLSSIIQFVPGISKKATPESCT